MSGNLPLRTLIWGFENHLSGTIAEIKAAGQLDVRVWIGSARRGADIDKRQLFERSPLDAPHFARHFSSDEFQELSAHTLSDFISMHTRWGKDTPHCRQQISATVQPLHHDMVQLFAYFYSFFDELLVTHNIEQLVFSNFPHQGCDIILYRLARMRGLRTLILTSSIFPDYSFYCHRIEDFGRQAGLPRLRPPEPVSIERTPYTDLFYMRGVGFLTELQRRLWGSVFLNLYWSFRWLLLHLKYLDITRNAVRRRGIRVKKMRWQAQRSSLSHMARVERRAPRRLDLDSPFIYFAMQLQPEMTTATLGGVFSDQLLALECLARKLPPGWRILVKENPKQTAFMRGRLFWKRFDGIPNVVLVPMHSDTFTLTAKSQFVATITGTVGWEAIKSGKPALVFGLAWYRDLPGVYEYHDDLDFAQIAASSIDHAAFEQAVAEMQSKMLRAVSDSDYRIDVERFDSAMNNQKLAKQIAQLVMQSVDSAPN